MSVLKPYMDSGKLVVRSKQTTMAQIATLRWDGALAQSRMDNLISANYSSENLMRCCRPTTDQHWHHLFTQGRRLRTAAAAADHHGSGC